MNIIKGAAHCYSDTMHNPTWSEMRKRSEPVMKGAAKSKGPAKSRKGDRVSWKYGKGTYSGTCINDSCSRARTENGKVKILPKNRK